MRVVLETVSEMERLGANHCMCWGPSDTDARAAVARSPRPSWSYSKYSYGDTNMQICDIPYFGKIQ